MKKRRINIRFYILVIAIIQIITAVSINSSPTKELLLGAGTMTFLVTIFVDFLIIFKIGVKWD